jgi:hypothetical protein
LFSTLNLVTPQAWTWVLTPNNGTLSISPTLDTAVVPYKTAANSYVAGMTQSVSTDGAHAGFNIAAAALPAAPAKGDLAIDAAGNLNWYSGAAWSLGAAADSVLTAGIPVLGNGANHVTAGTATGAGSVVLSIAPVISSPIISSFINSNHDHSNSSAGGPLAISAFAPAQPFANLPACSSAIEGARADITDSPVNTWGATVTTGGGSIHALLRCNGSNWTVLGI